MIIGQGQHGQGTPASQHPATLSPPKKGKVAGTPGGLSQTSCRGTDILKFSWESLPQSENLWTCQIPKAPLSSFSLSKTPAVTCSPMCHEAGWRTLGAQASCVLVVGPLWGGAGATFSFVVPWKHVLHSSPLVTVQCKHSLYVGFWF